ncbi:phage tail assembly chaperone [Oceanospirillaceae bacterium]|jgi:hypothetical protein|nr:phage tail assembly chaperone [Oceanospirillaceae bacterium]|tara:strand:- start:636 stop:983 length:348 start_codon:yes stop_codon:yes gene_type:complete
MDYLEIDDNGIAIGGIYQKMEGVDPSEYENWVEIKGKAQVGWSYTDGVWSEVVKNVTVDEIRVVRNTLLTESDWRDLPSYPDSDQEAWRTYRQELRDITDGYVPVPEPVYPTKPN